VSSGPELPIRVGVWAFGDERAFTPTRTDAQTQTLRLVDAAWSAACATRSGQGRHPADAAP
jgi:hypothetical protein